LVFQENPLGLPVLFFSNSLLVFSHFPVVGLSSPFEFSPRAFSFSKVMPGVVSAQGLRCSTGKFHPVFILGAAVGPFLLIAYAFFSR